MGTGSVMEPMIALSLAALLLGSDGYAVSLPRFVEEMKGIFEPGEIRAYLDGVRRVGALGHTASDEAYEEMQAAGAIPGGPVEWRGGAVLPRNSYPLVEISSTRHTVAIARSAW